MVKNKRFCEVKNNYAYIKCEISSIFHAVCSYYILCYCFILINLNIHFKSKNLSLKINNHYPDDTQTNLIKYKKHITSEEFYV